MKYKRLLIWLMLLASLQPGRAQTRIDQLVEHFSTMGSGTFTSAVKRDPKTHEVVMVVKKLESQGSVMQRLKAEFERQHRREGWTKQKTDGETVMSFCTETAREHRIYKLTYRGSSYIHGTVVIFIKYKQTIHSYEEDFYSGNGADSGLLGMLVWRQFDD